MTKGEWLVMRALFAAVLGYLKWIACRLSESGQGTGISLQSLNQLEVLNNESTTLIELTEEMEVTDVEA
tara:strand:+ start:3751 stop:3957 length:207 start_codon:yes stop_codon:yes gene_type:complete